MLYRGPNRVKMEHYGARRGSAFAYFNFLFFQLFLNQYTIAMRCDHDALARRQIDYITRVSRQ